jgi:hypothetical protein
VTLQPPDGPPQTRPAPASWPLTVETTREPGVYTLTTVSGKRAFFVVQSDPREGDLAAHTEADRERVAGLWPKRPDGSPGMTYAAAGATAEEAPAEDLELWWLVMAAAVALLLGEVWMTRRMAAGA